MKQTTLNEINIMEIGGFRLGQEEDKVAMTGCTVMLFDKQTPVGVDIRGGGPASRETPLLDSEADCKGLHAILLSGGSAYGLDAAGGVMRFLEERGIGLPVGNAVVPLVCQSCLFDLYIGNGKVRPDADMAYRACTKASYEPIQEGLFGAGTGCVVGKYNGFENSMRGGIGTYAIDVDGIRLGAIVAVNAFGDVYDVDTNQVIAGARNEMGELINDETVYFRKAIQASMMPSGNTTLGIIVTNAALNKAELNKVSAMAHNGFGRAIRPVHTMRDGDIIYTASTGDKTADVNVIGPMAAYVMAKAINRAVRATKEVETC